MLRCLVRYHRLIVPLLLLAPAHALRGKGGAQVLPENSPYLVETFINPQPKRFLHYYEFEVAPNNQWIDLEIDLSKTPMNDAGWDSHFEHATKIDAEHKVWTAEMRIPVSSMKVNALQPGDEWRLNLYRADGPGDDAQRRFMSWSPLPAGPNKSFHQPASFGIIKFVE